MSNQIFNSISNSTNHFIYRVNNEDIDRFEQKPKTLATFIDSFPKPGMAICDTPHVRNRLLALVSRQAFTGDQSEHKNALFKKTIHAFRNAFGLPTDEMPADELSETVTLYGNEGVTEGEPCAIEFSRRLLSLASNFDHSIPIDDLSLASVPLSLEALKAFKNYLYSGALPDFSNKTRIELSSFAKKIGDDELLAKINESRLATLLKEENAPLLLDPANFRFLEEHALKFTQRYLDSKGIHHSIEKPASMNDLQIKISLEDFVQIFLTQSAPEKKALQSLLARAIGIVEVSHPDSFSAVSLIDKKFRRAILSITTTAHYQLNFPKETLGHYAQHLQLFPNVDPQMLFPELYERTFLGHPLAKQHLKQILEAHPKAVYPYHLLARIDRNKAFEHIEKGFKMHKKDPSLIVSLISYIIGSDTEEIELLKKAIKLNPKRDSYYFQLLEKYEDVKDYKSSIKLLRECLRRFTCNKNELLQDLIEALHMAGKSKKVKRISAEAIKHASPAQSTCLLKYYYQSCVNLGDYESAIQVLNDEIYRLISQFNAVDKCSERRNQCLLSIYKLIGIVGRLYFLSNKFDNAIHNLHEAIKVMEIEGFSQGAKNCATYYAYLASIYEKQNLMSESESFFLKAIKLDSQNFWVNSFYGDYLKKSGHRSATAYYLKAIGIEDLENSQPLKQHYRAYKEKANLHDAFIMKRIDEVLTWEDEGIESGTENGKRKREECKAVEDNTSGPLNNAHKRKKEDKGKEKEKEKGK